MYGRIILNTEYEKISKDYSGKIKDSFFCDTLELIKDYFKPISFEYGEQGEIICLGESPYFEREWGLHEVIYLDDDDFEFWSAKKHENEDE